MKSVKKRFKILLVEIERVASGLVLLSSGLVLLEDVEELANRVLRACEDLRARASELSKLEFVDGIADADGLRVLRELVDLDAMSALEERFFAGLKDHDNDVAGELLQQLLEKLEERYVLMVKRIQQLMVLLDES